MIVNQDDYDFIAHYGTPRHSGRYPWGSGGNEDESPRRNPSFLDDVRSLKAQGLSDKEIYDGLGISSTQFRARKTIALQQETQANITRAQRLKDKGLSNTSAAKEMGVPESTLRSWLEPGRKARNEVLIKTAEILKNEVDKKKYLDIGSGTEGHVNFGDGAHLGVSPEKLKAAVAILQEQGYAVRQLNTPQLGTGLDTKRKVLVRSDVTQNEVWKNQDQIQQIVSFTSDGGKHWAVPNHDPISVNPNRVKVRYGDEGGAEADGVIFVREGAKDLSLGKNRYAQVRVLVGQNHYLKGMAVYKDNLPEGTDLVFNTTKNNTGNKFDAMKPIEPDKDFPFGSVVRQVIENPDTPQERNVSAMNLVNEQGDWAKWQKTISSQMLSKQSPRLAKEQLDMTFEQRKKDFDEINALTNPTVKKILLEKFADQTDAAAVHLKAAPIPGSKWHAILPLDSIKPTEVYAPNFNNGERVALVRYPHGGIFEIPELIVNNRHSEGKKLIGPESIDAIGIHHDVAKQLSGADFDGDTVLVIPNDTNRVASSKPLDGLKGFDPQSYKLPEGSSIPKMGDNQTQIEMGKISNLVTDMTLKAAPTEQLVRAIKHSMVVIDAAKHDLDYRQSYKDNGIGALKKEYQGRSNAGASTLISKKKSFRREPELKPRLQSQGGPIDKTTGARVFVETGRLRRDKKGNLVPRLEKHKLLEHTPDAHTLSSGSIMEDLYAHHSNKLKGLANAARLEMIHTPLLKQSQSAKRTYSQEVKELNASLARVISNRPKERHANAVANAIIKTTFAENPHLDEAARKKIRGRELDRARDRVGAKSEKIEFTDRQWNAIQAGAVSDNILSQLLRKADLDKVRERATPRTTVEMTTSKIERARSMLASGYTRAEVARALGVSPTTLDNGIK